MSRNDVLSEEMESMRQKCATLLETQEKHHMGLLAHERKAFEASIQEQACTIRQLHDDIKYNEVKFEEILNQQEAEYEMELRQLKDESESALAQERQNTTLKESQLSALINKYEALKKKIQEVKAASHSRGMY